MNSRARRRGWLLAALVAIALPIVTFVVASPAHGATMSNGWTEPVPMSSPAAGFLASGCNNSTAYIAGKYHIGVDFMNPADTPVHSIGSGTVLANADFGTGYARAVFVQYNAPDGTDFIVLYGHVNSNITANTHVDAGTQVGTVASITGSDPHLHLGLVPGSSYPSSNWGMMPCSSWPDQGVPDTNGFVDPSPFLNAHPNTPPVRHVPGDFNGDGRSDLVVYRPSEGNWYVQSPGIYSAVTQWGLPGDIPVAADYNGDGKTDYAVYRPSNQTWYLSSPGVYSQVTQFGWPGDVPVPGDFNGDGHADIATYRPSDQTWHINGVGTWQWGLPGDIPAVADFNGDGHDDMAVYRPSEGNWYILSPGVYSQVTAFGWPGDVPEPGSYGGGNAATQAVFRPSTQEWHANGVGTWQWGLPGDTPITGDFNGDHKTDLAVYRPSEGNWYVQGPGVYIQITTWGFPTDVPAVQTLPAPLLVQYGLISSY